MTNNQNSLDEILDGVFSHEDGDGFTCASRYRTCQECGQRYYFMNLHSKHPDAKKIDGSCDCSAKTDKAELEAAINKTIIEDLLAIIGDDIELIEESYEDDFSGETFTIPDVLAEEVNKYKTELRQQITKKYGRADND